MDIALNDGGLLAWVQAMLSAPVSQNNPAITWGLLLVVLVVVILLAKMVDDHER